MARPPGLPHRHNTSETESEQHQGEQSMAQSRIYDRQLFLGDGQGDNEGESEGMFLERIKIPESDHDTVPRVTSEAPSLRSKHLHRNKHKLKLSKKYLRAGPTKTFEFSNEVVQRYISGDRTTTSQQAGSDND